MGSRLFIGRMGIVSRFLVFVFRFRFRAGVWAFFGGFAGDLSCAIRHALFASFFRLSLGGFGIWDPARYRYRYRYCLIRPDPRWSFPDSYYLTRAFVLIRSFEFWILDLITDYSIFLPFSHYHMSFPRRAPTRLVSTPLSSGDFHVLFAHDCHRYPTPTPTLAVISPSPHFTLPRYLLSSFRTNHPPLPLTNRTDSLSHELPAFPSSLVQPSNESFLMQPPHES